jgi:hypothetical protein
MIGNKRVIIQPRDIHILQKVALLRAIDRGHATAIGKFKSVTRVNATLNRLVRAKLLNRFFLGVGPGTQKAIYTVTPRGAAVAQVPYRRFRKRSSLLYSGDLFLEHQLLLSTIYVCLQYSGGPARVQNWQTFSEPIAGSAVIPDAYFELANGESIRPVFLEVDKSTESKKIWKKKTTGYLSLALSGAFQKRFGHSQFRVLVVTTTESQLKRIQRTVVAQTSKVFWLTTFSEIKRAGLFSAIWLRPEGQEKLPLM